MSGKPEALGRGIVAPRREMGRAAAAAAARAVQWLAGVGALVRWLARLVCCFWGSPAGQTVPSAAAPLDDDHLLSEILLRLPPAPSSLPRASAVCRRWRSLVSEPGFSGRFRRHHRRNPPLLGFFQESESVPFLPTLEAPNCVPPGRFSLQSNDEDRYVPLGCRHGLFLIFLPECLHVLVWDPVTGDQKRIALPTAFHIKSTQINGAVLRAAGDDRHFQVVFAVADGDDDQHVQGLACVYSSNTGSWGNLVSTSIPYRDNGKTFSVRIYTQAAVLAGDCLYWVLRSHLTGILEFDLEKQSLTVMGAPVDKGKSFTIMRAEEGGGLGSIFISGSNAELWESKTDCDGVASWRLGRTIELGKLLSLKLWENRRLVILGFAEENNVLLLWTLSGIFMIHLELLKFKKLFKSTTLYGYYAFESVYTVETCAGGGNDRAELLLNK